MNAKILNLTLLAVSAVALFFILTSGIPLMDWGLVEFMGESKKRYVRATRYAFLGLTGAWVLAYCLFRKEFQDLGIIRFLKRLKDEKFGLVLGGMFTAYVVVMSAVGFMRHQAMATRAFDLGIFAQAVWNTTQGDFLYSSIKGGICLLGDHVSPILAVIAPFYMIWSDPRMLLLLQVIASASCVFMIAWIAKEKLQSNGAALLFSLMYLTYFPTRAVLHEDFHPETLMEPFMLLSFIFLEKKKIIPFLLCLMVMITGKENMLGIACFFGLYAFLFKKMRIFGGVIMVLSTAIFFWEISWLVPKLSGQPYLYRGSYDEFWSAEGGGILNQIFRGDSFEYLAKVFLPFLFLPFFHLPTLMLAAPVFFQNILSENDVMRSFNYHYTTGMTPFVFVAAIYGFHVLTTKFELLNKFRVFLLMGLFVASFIKSGASEYYYYWQSADKIDPYREDIRREMRKIPSKYSVLSHNNLIPQMINRKEIHQFDYHAATTKLDLAKKHDVDYVVMDAFYWEKGTEPIGPTIEKLKDAGYEMAFGQGDFVILRKQGLE